MKQNIAMDNKFVDYIFMYKELFTLAKFLKYNYLEVFLISIIFKPNTLIKKLRIKHRNFF